MKITLLSVGKTDIKLFRDIVDEYVKRVNHYIPFENIYLPDLKNINNFSEERQKSLVGDKLIKILKPTDYIVLLDDKGKNFSSIEFASYIEKK